VAEIGTDVWYSAMQKAYVQDAIMAQDRKASCSAPAASVDTMQLPSLASHCCGYQQRFSVSGAPPPGVATGSLRGPGSEELRSFFSFVAFGQWQAPLLLEGQLGASDQS